MELQGQKPKQNYSKYLGAKMNISQCSPMQINNINKKYITEPKITFAYQLNLTKSSAKPINPLNEKIILEHVESSWRQECPVGERRIVDTDWVRLTFKKIPTEGTFNLLQDPNDGAEPFYIFERVPYTQLSGQTPQAELMPSINIDDE
jgi:hypothetical protein